MESYPYRGIAEVHSEVDIGSPRGTVTYGDCRRVTTLLGGGCALIGASAMVDRNILMYFPWSRPDEEGAPLGDLNNRFCALFELRRLLWPKFEELADIEHFNQGIAGFLDNVLLQN